MSKRSAFSLIELSIILLVVAVVITMIANSSTILQTANLSKARSLTKSSEINDINGLVLWLETTSKDSFDNKDIEEGETSPGWNDIKKNHINPYTISATNQPTYRQNAINSLPALDFDGSNDCFQINNFQATSFMTLFIVGKFDAGSDDNFFIEHSSNAASNDGFYFSGYGSSPTLIRRTSSLSNSSSTNWFNGYIPAIGVMRHNSSNISYKRNNDDFTNTSSSLSNILINDTLNIGCRNNASSFQNGYLGEIIMFNRALSDDEVNDIVNYLKQKWQLEF